MITCKLFLFLFLIVLQAKCQDYCPDSCSSSAHGQCSKYFLRCVCNSGYFGENCGQQVPLLSDRNSQTFFVTPGSWEYFYLDIDCISLVLSCLTLSKDSMEDLKFEFEASKASVEYSFLLQREGESVLAEETEFRTLKIFSSELPLQSVTIESEKLADFEGGLLLVGIQNLDTKQTVTIKIRNFWGK